MAEFDPSSATVPEVLKKLEKADDAERDRILSAEIGGKQRSTILSEYGIDSDTRMDASGRTLYPWEVAPTEQVQQVVVEESEEARKYREGQQALQEAAEKAQPTVDEQGGVTPAGTGVTGSPAPGTGTGGGTTTDVGGTTL